MSANTIRKTQKRNNNYVTQNNQVIDKKTKNPSIHQDLNKSLQLIVKKQIKRVNEFIQKICQYYTPLTFFNQQYSNNSTKQLKQFQNMQSQIRRRNIQIKLLEEEVKNIQNGISSNKKLIQVYLSEELTTKSILLEKSMLKFKQKYQIYTKCKQNITQLQQIYISKCLNEAIQAISYQEFKQKYIQQKSNSHNENRNQTHKSHKKLAVERNMSRYFSVNQLKQRDFNTRINQKTNNTGRKIEDNNSINMGSSNKYLKELLNKKNVAEAALKAAKRKHVIEMNNYQSKLQFLSDQYKQLENKLNQKIRQLSIAERKFKQSRKRQNHISGRKQLRIVRTQTN